jgi:uncharacterized membrane protein
MTIKPFIKIIFWIIILILISPKYLHAVNNQDKSYKAKVIKILEEKEIEIMENQQLYQKLEIEIINGSDIGKKIIIENGNQPLVNIVEYKVNDRVLITNDRDLDGNEVYFITDFERKNSLMLLSIIFVTLTILVAKWKGLSSIISMIFTFLIIFTFILPKISSGSNPLLIVSLASIFIIPISFYLSHGLKRKTTAAILGSLIALTITGVLAYIFINFSHLSGLSSEEAGMLLLNRGGLLNMKGLLLAGIVIGALGVLDDITMSQSAIVEELAITDKFKKSKDLYLRAMNVGKDHIASMVNTLVLVYVGASLPLLLIFNDNPHPFLEIINYEMIAEEIIRTLIGSIGLIIAVPITTAIAVYMYKTANKNKLKRF